MCKGKETLQTVQPVQLDRRGQWAELEQFADSVQQQQTVQQEQTMQPTNIVRQYEILTAKSSAVLEEEYRATKFSGIGKFSKKKKMKQHIKNVRRGEAFFAAAIQQINFVEAQIQKLRKNEEESIQSYTKIVPQLLQPLQLNPYTLLKNKKGLSKEDVLFQLQDLFAQLQNMDAVLSKEDAAKLLTRYHAIGGTGLEKENRAATWTIEFLQDAAKMDGEMFRMLMLHTVAAAMEYRLQELPAEQINEAGFFKLYAFSASSGLLCGAASIHKGFLAERDTLRAEEGKEAMQGGRLTRHTEELQERRRQFLRTGIGKDGQIEGWILGEYAEQIEAYICEQKKIPIDVSSDAEADPFIAEAIACQNRIKEGREALFHLLKEKTEQHIPGMQESLLELLSGKLFEQMLQDGKLAVNETVIQKAEKEKKAQIEERKQYLDRLYRMNGLGEHLIRMPMVAKLVLENNKSDAFRKAYADTCGQLERNLKILRDQLQGKLTPVVLEKIFFSIFDRMGEAMLTASMAEIQELFQLETAFGLEQELTEEELAYEQAIIELMQSLDVEPRWYSVIYRKLTLADMPKRYDVDREKDSEWRKLLVKIGTWANDIGSNEALTTQYLPYMELSGEQWEKLLAWVEAHAADELRVFEKAFLETIDSDAYCSAGGITLSAYLNGGKTSEIIQNRGRMQTYKQLLEGEQLCGAEGIVYFLAGYESFVLEALQTIFANETLKNRLKLPFLKDVHTMADLETLSYSEFLMLSAQLRVNIIPGVKAWLEYESPVSFHRLYTDDAKVNLLPELLTGELTEETVKEHFQTAIQAVRAENAARDMRFMYAFEGEIPQKGKLQFQHLEDTTSTGIKKHSRGMTRAKRFENAGRVWMLLRKLDLGEVFEQELLELAAGMQYHESKIELAQDETRLRRLHEKIQMTLSEYKVGDKLKPLYDSVKEILNDPKSYIHEFRLYGYEDLIFAQEDTANILTQSESDAYHEEMRKMFKRYMTRRRGLEAELKRTQKKYLYEEYHMRMREMMIGLKEIRTGKEGAEDEAYNLKTFGIRSWEDAVGSVYDHINNRNAFSVQVSKGAPFWSNFKLMNAVTSSKTVMERQQRILELEDGRLAPLMPYLMKDEGFWSNLVNMPNREYNPYIQKLFDRLRPILDLLENEFAMGLEFQRQLLHEKGAEIIRNTEKTTDVWKKEFREYFEKFCDHTVAGKSISKEYQRFIQKNAKSPVAQFLPQILFEHSEGFSLLLEENKEKFAAIIEEQQKRYEANNRLLHQFIEGKQLSAREAASFEIYMKAFLLREHMSEDPTVDNAAFLESSYAEFIKARGAYYREVRTLDREKQETVRIFEELEQHRLEGYRAEQEDAEKLRELRHQLYRSGSPALVVFGGKQKPAKERITESEQAIKTMFGKTYEKPILDCLQERLLSGADVKTVQADAKWLSDSLQKIRGYLSKSRLRGEAIETELLLSLYLTGTEEALTEERLRSCVKNLGERHRMLKKLTEFKTEEASVVLEQCGLMDAMEIGLYTMETEAFHDLISRRIEYLQAVNVFLPRMKHLLEKKSGIRNAGEQQRLLYGLRAYFHKELLGGLANLRMDEIEKRTVNMLKDKRYCAALVRNQALSDAIGSESLQAYQQNGSGMTDRLSLEGFLGTQKDESAKQAYQALHRDQRQVFALTLLLQEGKNAENWLPSMKFSRNRNLEDLRSAGIQAQLQAYVNHERFEPVIPYDQVLAILCGEKNQLNRDAFDRAMAGTMEYIQMYRNTIPKDFSLLANGEVSRAAAWKTLHQEKNQRWKTISEEPVKSIEEFRARLQGMDGENKESKKLLARMDGYSAYDRRLLVYVLTDRTILDHSTAAAIGKIQPGFVNAAKREHLLERWGTGTNTAEYRLNSVTLTRAMQSLLGYQLRDDIALNGIALGKEAFAPDALARKTVVDWKLLARALDFMEEMQKRRTHRHQK